MKFKVIVSCFRISQNLPPLPDCPVLLAHLLPCSMKWWGTMSCVLHPVSCVLYPASSVRNVTAEVLKKMSPDFMQIFVMVAPPIILDFLW